MRDIFIFFLTRPPWWWRFEIIWEHWQEELQSWGVEFPLRKFEKKKKTREGKKSRVNPPSASTSAAEWQQILSSAESSWRRKKMKRRSADGWEMKMLGHNFLLIFYRSLPTLVCSNTSLGRPLLTAYTRQPFNGGENKPKRDEEV